jgi:hypothetical protein
MFVPHQFYVASFGSSFLIFLSLIEDFKFLAHHFMLDAQV